MTFLLKWQCASLDELSPRQLYSILKARCEVFISEQQCIYNDIDGKDLASLHLIAWDNTNEVAAYLRILGPDTTYPEPSIGRVLSTAKFRGTGIGRQLIHEGLKHLETHYPNQTVRISAQHYLLDFYSSFGFEAVSEEYLEDDIPHIEMLRQCSEK
jgi:ElaA protein